MGPGAPRARIPIILQHSGHGMNLFLHVQDPGVLFGHSTRRVPGKGLGSPKVPVLGVEGRDCKMPKRMDPAAFHFEAQGAQKDLPAMLNDPFGHVAARAHLLPDPTRAFDYARPDSPREEPSIRVHLPPGPENVCERRSDIDHLGPQLLLLPTDDQELVVDDVLGLEVEDLTEPQASVGRDGQEDVELRIRFRSSSQDASALFRKDRLRARKGPGTER